MKDFDIHASERKIEQKLVRIEKSKRILKENKQHIARFVQEAEMLGLKKGTLLRYLTNLRPLASHCDKDINEMDKQDFKKLVSFVLSKNKATRKKDAKQQKIMPETKKKYLITIKNFVRWLKNDTWQGEFPPEVDWIVTKMSKSDKRLPEEILTEEEVKALVDNAQTPRDRAFIGVLWESGARIGEFLTMKLKHVEFDDKGATLRLHGKTGSRVTKSITYAPYLNQWISIHPFKANKESPLFPSTSEKPLHYDTLRRIIRDTSKRAGIKKRVNYHSFRHSRATHLARFLTDAQLRIFFGWSKSSPTPALYMHLSARDVEDSLMQSYGLEPKKKRPEGLVPVLCPICKERNNANADLCYKCCHPLSSEQALKSLDSGHSKIESLIAMKVNEVLLGFLSNSDNLSKIADSKPNANVEQLQALVQQMKSLTG